MAIDTREIHKSIDEIVQLLCVTSREEWWLAESLPEKTTREDFLAGMAEIWDKTVATGKALDRYYGVETRPDPKTICINGHGPTSKANATFISEAPRIVGYLIDTVDSLLTERRVTQEKPRFTDEERAFLLTVVDYFDYNDRPDRAEKLRAMLDEGRRGE